MLESVFQAELKKEIEELFPGSIVLKTDTSDIQGFPDLLILYQNKWASLECKKNEKAPYRPNQIYYLELLNRMSFASVIWPEIKEEVLNELQHAFSARRPTRFSKRQ